jgi:hypothetical protein
VNIRPGDPVTASALRKLTGLGFTLEEISDLFGVDVPLLERLLRTAS